MNARFIFIRHGEAVGNVEDTVLGTLESPLTSRGQQQAEDRATTLDQFSPYLLYTSPMSRAVETAQIIGRHIKKGPLADKRLRERFVGQDLQGRPHLEVRGILNTEYEHILELGLDQKLEYRYSAAPDAETPREGADRLISFMQEVSEKYPGQNIVCVTHGAVLGGLLVSLGTIPFQGPFGSDGIGNVSVCILEFDSITKKVHVAVPPLP